ncbi:DUF2752 domain-containing protein [Nocardioides silvaticus]|uniref:DUF2752 domain-containing protein n=2 Tax=Nocardioides silvaticus TaxID=2201891 RepID=A0A316TPA4_9ACTN|nr:DUF2752 domain-containing protein [Nocardioides silvaticus]
MVPPALVVGGLAAATVALHLRDPHEQGTWGICPTKAVFGVECPGCGGLRAVNDLTNLQVVEAASSNLLFVAAIPLLVYVFARWSIGRWRGRAWDPSERAMTFSGMALIAVMAVFTVLRNTPAGSWLAP